MTLSTETKKYIYWTTSFVALFTILVIVYFNLGGFEQIQTAVARNNTYSLVGTEVYGKLTNKEEHFLFEEIKGHIADSSLRGTLSVVNYLDDTLGEYESRRFVGVLLDDEASMIPDGLTVLELDGRTTIQAALIMHPLVMPNSDKVEAIIKLKADSLGYTLKKFTLEKLYFDNSVIVEMFVE